MAGLGQYDSYASQSITMCGGYWSAAFSPIFHHLSNITNSLFPINNAIGFAKMLSSVTSIIHCFNEVVLVSIVKYYAVKKLGEPACATAEGTDDTDSSTADTTTTEGHVRDAQSRGQDDHYTPLVV